MVRRTRLAALLAVAATVAGAAIATSTQAAASRTMGGVRFVLRYQGSFAGSWRISDKRNDISGYKCGGYVTGGRSRARCAPAAGR